MPQRKERESLCPDSQFSERITHTFGQGLSACETLIHLLHYKKSGVMDLAVPTAVWTPPPSMNSSCPAKSNRYVTLALFERSKFLKCDFQGSDFTMYYNVS